MRPGNETAGFLRRRKYLLLAALTLAAAAVSLTLGRYPADAADVFTVMRLRLTGADPGEYAALSGIIFAVRLPRVAGALLIGAALAVSGAAYQGVFRNPLVSSDLLGVSAGAGFGAAMAILASANMITVHFVSFFCGLGAVAASYFISARLSGGLKEGTLVMVLAGILVSTVFQALIAFIKTVADPFNKLPAITYWLMGGLSSLTSAQLSLIAPPIIVGALPLLLLRWKLNLLTLGEEESLALGLRPALVRTVAVVCATLVTAAAVSVSGIIGWIGLVIPHLVRSLTGPDYRDLIPMSLFLGGLYLLVIDTVARTILTMEIPLGILTALIGAPFFVYLLRRMKEAW